MKRFIALAVLIAGSGMAVVQPLMAFDKVGARAHRHHRRHHHHKTAVGRR